MKHRFFRFKNIGLAALLGALFLPQPAHASMFKGETLDQVANIISWIVLIVAPVVGIVGFWLVHILPEKIAEKKHHPQAAAIQTLCLLSLVFGGILWPLAWLWAYTKPVGYKLAYGTDVADEHGTGEGKHSLDKKKLEEKKVSVLGLDANVVEVRKPGQEPLIEDLRHLRERLNELTINAPDDPKLAATIRQIAELEKQFASASPVKGEKA